ncbi:MAG TPA: alkaline shock response membrane anchor protein AmaP, partial [Clostridia bacterium]|nr:alkaline shock response membrane anchor protein AmaP [Clostridia bacterium]
YNIGVAIRNAGFFSGIRLAVILISVVFLGIVVSILFTFSKKDNSKPAIKISNAGGTVSISSQTLESLARLVAKNADNVYDIRTDVLDMDNKPSIEIRVKVPPVVSIPAISATLQESIRSKIMETTGTDIENIRIVVDGIVEADKKQ